MDYKNWIILILLAIIISTLHTVDMLFMECPSYITNLLSDFEVCYIHGLVPVTYFKVPEHTFVQSFEHIMLVIQETGTASYQNVTGLIDAVLAYDPSASRRQSTYQWHQSKAPLDQIFMSMFYSLYTKVFGSIFPMLLYVVEFIAKVITFSLIALVHLFVVIKTTIAVTRLGFYIHAITSMLLCVLLLLFLERSAIFYTNPWIILVTAIFTGYVCCYTREDKKT
ncbi:hypothetical protein [Aliagarivorans marinus]|uniref:hypothetical protein n=1 Tax=Aliagarivorans marinus TaxID=561965 RepID=UPI00047C579B|nr:hypothetical protein [Aliagarivorans marinus]